MHGKSDQTVVTDTTSSSQSVRLSLTLSDAPDVPNASLNGSSAPNGSDDLKGSPDDSKQTQSIEIIIISEYDLWLYLLLFQNIL